MAASQRAAEAAILAAELVSAAASGVLAAPPEPIVSEDPVVWPPPSNSVGYRYWFARGVQGIPDGCYSLSALVARGVDADAPVPKGLLQGFKTVEPAVRRAAETGVSFSVFYWR